METKVKVTRPVKSGSKYYDYCVKCYENIKRVLSEISVGKVTVLTGENATGKSLVRKLLWSVLEKQMEGKSVRITDTSMYRFTDSRADMVESSGRNFIRFINHWKEWKDRYIVIDAPELGLSESFVLGMVDYLNKVIPEFMKNNYGIMVITHSKDVVRRLGADVFLNMDNLDKEDWLNATPAPVDIMELIKCNSALKKFLSLKLSEQKEENDKSIGIPG